MPPSTTANRRVGAVFDHPPLAGKLKGERREKRAFCSQEGEERERKEKNEEKMGLNPYILLSRPDPFQAHPGPKPGPTRAPPPSSSFYFLHTP